MSTRDSLDPEVALLIDLVARMPLVQARVLLALVRKAAVLSESNGEDAALNCIERIAAILAAEDGSPQAWLI